MILYADNEATSIRTTVAEFERRREVQLAYNPEHGITPKTIVKPLRDSIDSLYDMNNSGVNLPEATGQVASRVAEDSPET